MILQGFYKLFFIVMYFYFIFKKNLLINNNYEMLFCKEGQFFSGNNFICWFKGGSFLEVSL